MHDARDRPPQGPAGGDGFLRLYLRSRERLPGSTSFADFDPGNYSLYFLSHHQPVIYYYLQGDQQTQHAVARTNTAAALLKFGEVLRKEGFSFTIFEVHQPGEGQPTSETPLTWEMLQAIAAQEKPNAIRDVVQLAVGPK